MTDKIESVEKCRTTDPNCEARANVLKELFELGRREGADQMHLDNLYAIKPELKGTPSAPAVEAGYKAEIEALRRQAKILMPQNADARQKEIFKTVNYIGWSTGHAEVLREHLPKLEPRCKTDGQMAILRYEAETARIDNFNNMLKRMTDCKK